jgi:hypothetical protein
MLRFFSQLLALALVGCSPTSYSSPEATRSPQASVTPSFVLRTDRDDYLANPEKPVDEQRIYGFTLIARFENRTQEPVYLDRCYPNSPNPMYAILMADESEEHSAAYSPNWACVGHNNPILVEPGQTLEDRLHVSGPNVWESDGGAYKGALEGRFRLVYRTRFCREQPSIDHECDRPEVGAQSNVYTVRLDQPAGSR